MKARGVSSAVLGLDFRLPGRGFAGLEVGAD